MDNSYYLKYEPIFGAWRITRFLGEGRGGKVFEIQREEFGVTYRSALRVITVPDGEAAGHRDAGGAAAYYKGVAQKITREVELMSRMRGGDMVNYEDYMVGAHADGVGWDILVRMELLTPLGDYLADRRPSREDAVRLGIDLCRALELCRKHDVIHREIRPENIFVSDSGGFKLGDFGVADRAAGPDAAAGRREGSLYTAPEAYRGDVQGAGADIYALGMVMYQMLNDGRAPFLPAYPRPVTADEREAALARRMGAEPLPPPGNAEPGLAAIVLRALAHTPRERYLSPRQLREELEALRSAPERAAGDMDGQTIDLRGLLQDGAVSSPRAPGPARPAPVVRRQVSPPPAKKKFPILAVLTPLVLGLAVLTLVLALGNAGRKDGGDEPDGSAAPPSVSEAVTPPSQTPPPTQNSVKKITNPDGSWTENEYDADGRLLSSAKYDASGVRRERSEPRYGEDGEETERVVSYYNEKGTLSYYTVSRLDENGTVVSTDFHRPNGSRYESREFDSHGKDLRTTKYGADGTVTERYEMAYGADGEKTGRTDIFYNGAGELSYRVVNELDPNGNVSSARFFGPEGWMYELREFRQDGALGAVHRYDDKGVKVSLTEYSYVSGAETGHAVYELDKDGEVLVEYHYKPNGELVETVDNRGEGEATGTPPPTQQAPYSLTRATTEYLYDESGYKSREIYRNEDGQVVGWMTFGYDENGGLSAYAEYNWNGEVLRAWQK